MPHRCLKELNILSIEILRIISHKKLTKQIFQLTVMLSKLAESSEPLLAPQMKVMSAEVASTLSAVTTFLGQLPGQKNMRDLGSIIGSLADMFMFAVLCNLKAAQQRKKERDSDH